MGAPPRVNADPRGGGGAPNMMNRAERFEDEKRRIVETCFSKREVDGSGMQPSSLSRMPRGSSIVLGLRTLRFMCGFKAPWTFSILLSLSGNI